MSTRTAVLERSLGDTRDAAVLIPGDADAVRADARALDETAETLATVADGIGGTVARQWAGKAASTFSQTTTAMRTRVLVAANAMGTAATALHAYASTLEWAQDQARAAIRSFDAAAACVAPDPLGTMPSTAGQHRALASLDDARSQVHRSAASAAAALQDACVDAPIGPGLWNQVGYQWSELWHGAAESFSGLGHLVWDHSTVRRQLDPDGTVASDTALALGLVAAVKDPVQLGKDVIDYDTWATSPARAIGHLAPDAAIAALTAGGGLVASRGASAAFEATRSVAEAPLGGVLAKGAQRMTSGVIPEIERGGAGPTILAENVQVSVDDVAGLAAGGDNAMVLQSSIADVGPSSLRHEFEIGSKIEKQMAVRGWTRSSIDELIGDFDRTVNTRDTRWTPMGARLNDPATAYIRIDGAYVVRNDLTGDIVQVSNRHDLEWRSPW
jgi:uncharacterized protein YukE